MPKRKRNGLNAYINKYVALLFFVFGVSVRVTVCGIGHTEPLNLSSQTQVPAFVQPCFRCLFPFCGVRPLQRLFSRPVGTFHTMDVPLGMRNGYCAIRTYYKRSCIWSTPFHV